MWEQQLEKSYGRQPYRLTAVEQMFLRSVPGTVTSRFRSFNQQADLVSRGASKEWLSQHCFGLAFDFIPRRAAIPEISRYALALRLTVIEESSHFHLQGLSREVWRDFKASVEAYLTRVRPARVRGLESFERALNYADRAREIINLGRRR